MTRTRHTPRSWVRSLLDIRHVKLWPFASPLFVCQFAGKTEQHNWQVQRTMEINPQYDTCNKLSTTGLSSVPVISFSSSTFPPSLPPSNKRKDRESKLRDTCTHCLVATFYQLGWPREMKRERVYNNYNCVWGFGWRLVGGCHRKSLIKLCPWRAAMTFSSPFTQILN